MVDFKHNKISVLHFGVLVLLALPQFLDGAKILFFFGISSYSHRIAVWPLSEALAARGHSVTFLSPYPAKSPNPNVTDYIPLSLKEWVDNWNETETFSELRVTGEMELEWYKIFSYGTSMCDVLLGDPSFLSWLQSNKFDLFVVDALINECAYGFAHLHGAKVIVYNTAIPFPWSVDPFGFPDESSWIPDFVYHYPPATINLAQRAIALFNPLYFNYYREMEYFPRLESKLRSVLVPDMPSISELERNVSLLFVNHHPAEDYARPFPPNVIPLPGLHCALPKENNKKIPLSPDFQAFLGDSPFIYVSFGSYVEITHFSPTTITVFIKTLNALKKRGLKVVWKMASQRLEGLEDHVYISEWMPQQAILRQPNIRAFITHAGLLGIQEAITYAVPLIAFPIFAEQDYNANKLEWKRVGIQLEIISVTEAQLQDAIKKVLEDDTYATNMKILSAKFLDRPMPVLDVAIYWTEYVLRHDTSHLRPLSIYQAWWKKRQLDIWAGIFLLLLISIRISIWLAILITRKCKKKQSNRLNSSSRTKKIKSS